MEKDDGYIRSSESLPLLQRRPSKSPLDDARRVLSKPSGILGGVNAASHRDIVKRAKIRNVIFPFDTSYQIWWFVTAMGAIMTAFLLPYEIAFQTTGSGKLDDAGAIVEDVLVIIFTVDILVNFNLAIYKDSRLTL